jgi:hypothetical protein
LEGAFSIHMYSVMIRIIYSKCSSIEIESQSKYSAV